MKLYKTLLAALAILSAGVGFSSCEGEQALPPVIMPNLTGDGTYQDPYNVTRAMILITSGQAPSQMVCVKGIVSEITEFGASYGNMTYYISDDGTTDNQLEVYRGKGLNNNKFNAESDLNVGDEVIVYGQMVYFNDKYAEITQGSWLLMLNGVEADNIPEVTPPTPPSTVEPAGEGTLESPYNIARAQAIIASGQASEASVYIEGIVSEITEIGTGFGNATYYVSDDGSKSGQLMVYRGYGLDGAKIESADYLKEGDKVVVYGVLVNFKGNTPEVTQGSKIVKLNGQGGTTPDTPDTPVVGGTVYSGLEKDANDWTFDNVNLPEAATYIWAWKVYNNAGYLNGSGYVGGALESEAYAYTKVDLSNCKAASATFEHAAKFQTTLRDLCGMVVREQGTEAWTALAIPTWPEAGSWTFVSAGSVDLSAFAGKKVELGFKYASTAAGADTWEIRKLVVSGN